MNFKKKNIYIQKLIIIIKFQININFLNNKYLNFINIKMSKNLK